MTRWFALAVAISLLVACGGVPSAHPLTTNQDSCAQCRQLISDPLLAAQLVIPGEPPRFFDDIGCLVEYLGRNTRLRDGAIAYVADHRTGDWIPAASALYTRSLQIRTPAGSHVIAHATAENQAADPVARAGIRLSAKDLLPIDMPNGAR